VAGQGLGAVHQLGLAQAVEEQQLEESVEQFAKHGGNLRR